jgi:hypothetical protein
MKDVKIKAKNLRFWALVGDAYLTIDQKFISVVSTEKQRKKRKKVSESRKATWLFLYPLHYHLCPICVPYILYVGYMKSKNFQKSQKKAEIGQQSQTFQKKPKKS